MSKFGIETPRIDDEDIFEEMCLDLLKVDRQYENVQLNGRRGQRQHGVDIFARIVNDNSWIGVQCKVKTDGQITISEIELEIKKALDFNPKLKRYYLYTTAKRDANIQKYIRQQNDSHIKAKLFGLEVVFWEDITRTLNEEPYKQVHFKYYRGYYTHFNDDGYSFGKLINLSVSSKLGGSSRFELMIGKTFTKTESYNGLDYWKGINFIMDMNARTFETFPKKCFPSDIERAICNVHDRYIISKWLNSIGDVEDFIKSNKQEEYIFSITDDEYEELFFDDGE